MRILIVEDARKIAEAAAAPLHRDGFAVDIVETGQAADEALALQAFDLVILDLGLPDVDGTALIVRWRARGTATPILVLTARTAVEARVSALDRGADDYLIKPFEADELAARCRALLRRARGEAHDVLRAGALVLDRVRKSVSVAGVGIELPNREFRLLDVLLTAQGRVLSKEEIAGKLYGFDDAAGPNAIEVYVARLRKRLEGSGITIRTLRGLGYTVQEDAS
ncbi:response regulator transcription factor [Salinarimonas sp.]|uniref:response regulator transcription factor n=1 Tax=Salinarimonas sp. TaxID=2766526 RepID=UPI0032D9A3C8